MDDAADTDIAQFHHQIILGLDHQKVVEADLPELFEHNMRVVERALRGQFIEQRYLSRPRAAW